MENTFNKDIILSNEQQRLEALRRYKIFNTEAEKSFKNIARLVAEIFNVSISMISLVDDEEVSFQSNVGMENSLGPRGESFCSLTVLSPEVHVVENALVDPVVYRNPLVFWRVWLTLLCRRTLSYTRWLYDWHRLYCRYQTQGIQRPRKTDPIRNGSRGDGTNPAAPDYVTKCRAAASCK
jgi:hypothetical protein